MSHLSFSLLTILVLICFAPGELTAQDQSSKEIHQAKSQWVHLAEDGKINYQKLPSGDRIMDFSHAGYMGGGVKIPDVPIKITVSPVEGDNTDMIQDAIDQVSKMKLENGFRGAVLLEPGKYDCERELSISSSGVVLRGSGSGADGTILNLTGKPHTCIVVRGEASVSTIGEPQLVSDAYVPSGEYSFSLNDASGFAVGDTILIIRPVTDAWVHFMEMDHLIRDGKEQTWISGEITCDRTISLVSGNRVTVDVPLTDSFDSNYLNPPGTSVVKISTKGELSQIGIENLRIVSPDQSGTINERHHRAFTIGRIADAWVRNLKIFNTVNSVSVTGKRITIDQVGIVHNIPTVGAAKPADFNGSGSQLLFNRCSVTGDNLFFFATGAKVTGPVVLLNCVFRGNGWIQPHQRWATGILVDGCQVPDGGIDFMNRGEYGSGHGWSVGWAVAWNSKAKTLLNQQPPGSANWMIGCEGEKTRRPRPFNKEPNEPEGIYDSHGTPVTPASLYLAQLSERLGRQALENIGELF
jgi:hypothetical protein